MAKIQALKPAALIAGIVLVLGASAWVAMRRLQQPQKVEVRAENKPPVAAAKAPPPRAPIVRPPQAPAAPAPRAPAPAPALPGSSAETSTEDWTYVCASEAGILCHGVTAGRLARCLKGHEDALLNPCRHALGKLRSSLAKTRAKSSPAP